MKKGADVSNDALIQENVSLLPYNTLATPAMAAYLCRCRTLEQLNASIEFANKRALPVLVLGEGSNIVFSRDFDGLVILNRLTGIHVINEDPECVSVEVAAGENWHDFVQYSLNQAWYGLENLALIPGLVGAAPIQNIGAYGVEVKDTIERVSAVDIKTQKKLTFTNDECQFAYRESAFKRVFSDKVIVTSVVFRLLKSPSLSLSYPSLAERLDHHPTPVDVFNAVCDLRSSKLPMPDDIPNAGSFFKNPIVNKDQYAKLKESFPNIVAFNLEGADVKLAAAWLIEQCGWKQKSVDAVYVHRDQALVVVNPNGKDGNCVLKLAAAIQNDITAKYGVSLEIEPRVI